jgi:thiamine-phosphate pyrophosphorylase
MKKIGKLCVITDTVIQKKYSHFEAAKLAIKGGADIIQLRDKTMSTAEMITTPKQIAALCKKHGVTFLVNDRVDIAMLSGADGVHLGIEDIPIKEARKLLGKNKIIGGTAHSLKEALKAQKEGADYIGFGHIFTTGSKHKPDKPKGTKMLAQIVKKIKTPILAIGGIDQSNINEVMKTGVHGAAIIGGIYKSPDPVKTTKEIRNLMYAKK